MPRPDPVDPIAVAMAVTIIRNRLDNSLGDSERDAADIVRTLIAGGLLRSTARPPQ